MAIPTGLQARVCDEEGHRERSTLGVPICGVANPQPELPGGGSRATERQSAEEMAEEELNVKDEDCRRQLGEVDEEV